MKDAILIWLVCFSMLGAVEPVVIDSQTTITEKGSITYERIVPPVLKPQPVKLPVFATSIPAATPATENSNSLSLMILSHPVDATWTEVRVYLEEVEGVFRTTLPLRHLDCHFDFTVGEKEISLFHIYQSSGLDEAGLAREKLLPSVALPTQWVWLSKGVVLTEMKQAVEDLHRAYDAHQTMLRQAYFEREAQRTANEKALAANPPKPKDTVIQFFPIRSSSR